MLLFALFACGSWFQNGRVVVLRMETDAQGDPQQVERRLRAMGATEATLLTDEPGPPRIVSFRVRGPAAYFLEPESSTPWDEVLHESKGAIPWYHSGVGLYPAEVWPDTGEANRPFEGTSPVAPPGYRMWTDCKPDCIAWLTLPQPLITAADVQDSKSVFSEYGSPSVARHPPKSAGERLRSWSSTHTGEYLLITVGDRVLSAPIVRGVISDSAMIEMGAHKPVEELSREANLLAHTLAAGPLDGQWRVVEVLQVPER